MAAENFAITNILVRTDPIRLYRVVGARTYMQCLMCVDDSTPIAYKSLQHCTDCENVA